MSQSEYHRAGTFGPAVLMSRPGETPDHSCVIKKIGGFSFDESELPASFYFDFLSKRKTPAIDLMF